MPLFEYICRDCGEACEILVRDSRKPACPACGSRKLDKQISAPATPRIASKFACQARDSRACGVSDCGGCPCSPVISSQ